MRITRTSANYLDEGGTRYLLEQIHDIIDEEISIQSGLPEGGNTGQVLAKASNENFDVTWVNQSGGGGGGGSTVTITPTLFGGTKIAEYSIDGVSGELYAPNGGGGGGGTDNYNNLTNLPSINNVTLIGNKSFGDLGLSNATSATSGLMSAYDKTKLDGIAANANNYHLPTGGSSGQVLGWTSDGTGQWVNQSGGGGGDLSNYYTKAETDQQIYDAVSDEAAYTSNTYATKNELATSLTDYYKKEEVNDLIPTVTVTEEITVIDGEEIDGINYKLRSWNNSNNTWDIISAFPTLGTYANHTYFKGTLSFEYDDQAINTELGVQNWQTAPEGKWHRKMYQDVIDTYSYANMLEVRHDLDSWKNLAGNNFVDVPNPAVMVDLSYSYMKDAYYYDSTYHNYYEHSESLPAVWSHFIKFRVPGDHGTLTFKYIPNTGVTGSLICWTTDAHPSMFYVHDVDDSTIYNLYGTITVNTASYDYVYLRYTDVTRDQFTVQVLDENNNEVAFIETPSDYRISSIEDYLIKGMDIPANGTMRTVTVSGETQTIRWIAPLSMRVMFSTNSAATSHNSTKRYMLIAPTDFGTSKYVHSISTKQTYTHKVPVDMDDYYTKDEVDDIVSHIPGGQGQDGTTFTPAVTSVTGGYELSWTNDGGKQNPQTVTILNGINGTNGTNGTDGQDGQDGADGFSPVATVTPTVSGATISITDKNGTTTANITNGTNGQNGTNGTDGVSPTVSVTTITGGHTVTITDASTTSTFNVMDGQDGANGTNGVDGNDGADGFSPTATVTQTLSGATISITDKNGTTTANINNGTNGTNGTNGQDGADGFSPTATVTPTANGATISITDKNGTTTANVSNGTNGTNGQDGVTPVITATASVDANTGTPSVTVTKTGTDATPSYAFAFSNLKGAAGYTPVRGTDYWTTADIATIQNYIDTELGVISNGSY